MELESRYLEEAAPTAVSPAAAASRSFPGIAIRKLYFPLVMLIELGILAAFVMFLIYMVPTLDPRGYIFFGEAPHVPYLQQAVSGTPITVIRWAFFLLTAGALLPMMVTIILELIRWRINTGSEAALPSKNKVEDNKEHVVRFGGHLRLQHLLLMIGATLAGVIGLSQAFPDWAAAQWFLQDFLGGLESGRQLHHYFAYIVDFTVVYFAAYIFYKFAIKREKMRAMLPTFQDLKDFIDINLYIFGKKKAEPQYGRYTFGQKIDFYLILVSIPILSLSGLSMHYTGISSQLLTPTGVAIAAVVHRSVAVFLAWFILSVHMYYAHLAPGLFPANNVIFSGKMSKSRYRQLFPRDDERL